MSLTLHASPYALLLKGLRLRTTAAPASPARRTRRAAPHWTDYLSGRDTH